MLKQLHDLSIGQSTQMINNFDNHLKVQYVGIGHLFHTQNKQGAAYCYIYTE